MLKRYIVEKGLVILDNPHEGPTLQMVNGQSYVDLTLVTAGLTERVKDWETWPEAIQSDHRMIKFTMETNNHDGGGIKTQWFSI